MRLPVLLKEIRSCRVCEASLPLGPKPLVQISAKAPLLIIGQSPGRVAHESGVPWSDKSGDRLRDWLGIDSETFYNSEKVALMPMGFCFPGTGKGGDMAPRPECEPLWHAKLLEKMPGVKLTVFVGAHAFARYLGGFYPTVTEAVRDSESLLPDRISLPHPSPRNNLWLKKNPWFERKVLKLLRERCGEVLGA